MRSNHPLRGGWFLRDTVDHVEDKGFHQGLYSYLHRVIFQLDGDVHALSLSVSNGYAGITPVSLMHVTVSIYPQACAERCAVQRGCETYTSYALVLRRCLAILMDRRAVSDMMLYVICRLRAPFHRTALWCSAETVQCSRGFVKLEVFPHTGAVLEGRVRALGRRDFSGRVASDIYEVNGFKGLCRAMS